MEKNKRERRRGKFFSLSVLFIFMLVPVSGIWADQGQTGGYEDTSGVDSSNFLTRTVNSFGRGLGNLLGVREIFSELSPADVGHKPRIRPHFAFDQGFNSNARLHTGQADAAWQARVAPGITVSVPSGKLYTEADYTYAFSTTQGRKTNANVNTHNVNALARYTLSADTTLGAGNNIQLSEVPGEPGRTFILETATAQVNQRVGPKLTANLTDTFQWFRDRTRVDGATSFDNDFVDNTLALYLPYDITADLSLGPGFAWTVRDFKKVNAKDYWQIAPAVQAGYRLGPKTNLAGNFGWALRRFSGGGDNTEAELVYGASASHKLGRKFIWGVSYSKTLQDTFNTSFVFRETPTSNILDNFDRDFRLLKVHQIGSSASYHFSERQSLNAFGNFQLVEGEMDHSTVTPRRSNDEKAMEVGSEYVFRYNRYIALNVRYTFGRRFSTDSGLSGSRDDYTFHKVTGGVNLTV